VRRDVHGGLGEDASRNDRAGLVWETPAFSSFTSGRRMRFPYRRHADARPIELASPARRTTIDAGERSRQAAIRMTQSGKEAKKRHQAGSNHEVIAIAVGVRAGSGTTDDGSVSLARLG